MPDVIDVSPSPDPPAVIDVPEPPSLRDRIVDAAAPALLAALGTDTQAYFEKLARTEPKLFLQWAQFLAPLPNRTVGSAQQNIVNIVSPIPRTALDDMPADYTLE